MDSGIRPIRVSSALAKPLEAYNTSRRNACCHLTIRNFSTHPLKASLQLTSSNALLLNCESGHASGEADRYIMPGSHSELVVHQNGWRSEAAKYKIFFTYHVTESSADMSRKLATWFCQFLLPVSVVYDRKVSYFCGFAKTYPEFDLPDENRRGVDEVFEYWKDQLLQLSRYALQAQDQCRFLDCFASDSKFAEIKIDFSCRCPQCLSGHLKKADSTLMAYPLHEAVLDADASKIAAVLHEKTSADSLDFRHRSPLHLAAKENFFDIAKLLLKQGANRNAKDIEQATPMIEAAFWGSFDVVKVLVTEFTQKEPCDLKAAAVDGRTALHVAAWQNHALIVKFLLDKDRTLVNTGDAKGYTALHLAAEAGSFESLKVLLDNYADSKLLTLFGATALHLACRGAHTDVVDLLMNKCGAQKYLAVEDAFGFSPVRYAIYTDCVPFVTVLVNYGANLKYVSSLDKRSAAHDAAEIGSSHMLRFLIADHRVRADTRDLYGDTPMHIASYFGQVNIVRDLTEEYRVSTSIKNLHGATPFFLACQQGQLVVAKYFLKVDPYLMHIPIADDGRLPIHYAIYNGHEDVVAAIIEHGADILLSNDARRKTVFDFAVEAGRSNIAEILIKALKKK